MKTKHKELIDPFGFFIEVFLFIATGVFLVSGKYLLTLVSYFFGLEMAIIVGKEIKRKAIWDFCALRENRSQRVPIVHENKG
jgi:hypothetical protein